MKKSYLLLSALILTMSTLVSCGGTTTSETTSSGTTTSETTSESTELIDYASQLTLDTNSGSAQVEVTVKQCVDGDTTHFNLSSIPSSMTEAQVQQIENLVYKARYLGIDTPESTGKVQPWGKAASNFTKAALTSATSIIIEQEAADGTYSLDSTGGRFLTWVWYKNDNAEDEKYHQYRLLNLELAQEGLAWSKNSASYRYYEYFQNAFNQAISNGLKCQGNAKDPDYFYGEAQEVTLNYLREKTQYNEETNEYETVDRLAEYKDTLIRFEGVVSRIAGNSLYITETGKDAYGNDHEYGMQVFYGYKTITSLEVGARFSICGTLQYYEAGGYYQVSGIKDRGLFEIASDESYRVDTVTYDVTPFVIDYEEFSTRSEELEFANTKFENLTVKSIYTTTSGSSTGAMTITTEDPDGNEIKVRTAVLTKTLEDGTKETVTASDFEGKTFNAVGMVQPYTNTSGTKTYQFEVYSFKDVTFVE
jgi:micrococcal nuclease